MAKRLLRDWTASERMDGVSMEAEVFFTRLIMKADDYGSYHSNPKLLKAALFPLKEMVTYKDIGKWVCECFDAGLIFLYEVDGKEYIRINNFGQRLQQKRSVFPHPTGINGDPRNPTVENGVSPPEREVEEKKEDEVEVESEDARAVFVDENVPRELKIEPPDKNQIFEEIFSDDLFVEALTRSHPKKNIQRAWNECWLYHSQKPSPPTLGWQWRQKLSTWLINTKDESTRKTKAGDAINSRREGFAKRHSSDAGGQAV
jgi:hypothetical protein